MATDSLLDTSSTRSTGRAARRRSHAVKRPQPRRQARRDRRAARLVRLRQDLDAAHDRRLRGGDARHDLARRQARSTTCRRRKRDVAMAFEGYSLYPPLTVRENIAFALKAARLPAPRSTSRSTRSPSCSRSPTSSTAIRRSISGGQQQRASLGRALVRNADLYLLDEPMGQLEPQLRAVLRGRIKHYLREHRTDHDPRHPRPDRGERARRPHRGDGRRRAAAVRTRPPRSRSARPTCSSAPSSASRR